MAAVVALNQFKEYYAECVMCLLLLNNSCVLANGLDCKKGPAVTYKVPVNFTVTEQPVTPFGCLEGLNPAGSKVYPGQPEHLVPNVSAADSSFQLSWKPPDDSSVGDVKGFLLKMFIKGAGDVHSFLPSRCYRVDTKLSPDHHYAAGKAVQEAAFHVECKMQSPLNVYVKVLTLPVPPPERRFKEATADVTFKGTTARTSTTVETPVTKMLTEPPEAELESTSAVAIALGAIFVSVFVTTCVVFMVCRNKRHAFGLTQSQANNTSTSSQMHKGHYCPNTTEKTNCEQTIRHKVEEIKGDGRYTNTHIPFTNNISQDYERMDHCLIHKANIQNVGHNVSHQSYLNRGDTPIPQPYRSQLERINLDS